jgi:hypothetical protein
VTVGKASAKCSIPPHSKANPISPVYQRQNCCPATRSMASSPKYPEPAVVTRPMADATRAALVAGSRGRIQKIAAEVRISRAFTSRIGQPRARLASIGYDRSGTSTKTRSSPRRSS